MSKQINLMVLGDIGTGKTSILNRYIRNTFNTEIDSTMSMDLKIKTIKLNGKTIKLKIWDTAGQERFAAINTAYYRSANGIMLVYDITNAKSFRNITEKWLKDIDKQASTDVKMILLANKCDMGSKRVVSTAQGEELAESLNIPFLETSAKANIDIVNAIHKLVETVLEKIQQSGGSKNGQDEPNPRVRLEAKTSASGCCC